MQSTVLRVNGFFDMLLKLSFMPITLFVSIMILLIAVNSLEIFRNLFVLLSWIFICYS